MAKLTSGSEHSSRVGTHPQKHTKHHLNRSTLLVDAHLFVDFVASLHLSPTKRHKKNDRKEHINHKEQARIAISSSSSQKTVVLHARTLVNMAHPKKRALCMLFREQVLTCGSMDPCVAGAQDPASVPCR